MVPRGRGSRAARRRAGRRPRGVPAWCRLAVPGTGGRLHLLAYPLFGACLLIFVRRRTPAHDWGAILDAAVVTIGVASVVWALVLSSVTDDPTLSTWEKAVSAAYPVAGIVLFGLVVRLVLTTGLGVAANALIALATTVLLVGDGLYVYGLLEGWYQSGSVLDVAQVAVPVLWAAAALDPSMRRLTQLVEQPESWPIRRRVVVLGCAVTTTTAMVVVEAVRGPEGVSGVIVIAALALLAAVSARLANVVLCLRPLPRSRGRAAGRGRGARGRALARGHLLRHGADRTAARRGQAAGVRPRRARLAPDAGGRERGGDRWRRRGRHDPR